MANVGEYFKGISIFLLTTLMFYFYWDNIFLNVINWAGTDFICEAGETACVTALATSYAILKSLAWVTFLAMYLAIGPIYLIFAIISGSRNDVVTKPIELLKGLGIWVISMPLLTIILGIIYRFITVLTSMGQQTHTVTSITGNTVTQTMMDTGSLSMASNFSWILTLIVMIAVAVIPFYWILKGYGIEMGGAIGQQNDVRGGNVN